MKTESRCKHTIFLVLSIIGLLVPIFVLSISEDAGFILIPAVFGGYIFADRPVVTGGALDQGSLHKELFILCYNFLVTFPVLATVRWLNTRNQRTCRLILASVSSAILIQPLATIILFTYDTSRYIFHMGYTPKRLVALIIAAAAFIFFSLFTAWIWKGTRQTRPTQNA